MLAQTNPINSPPSTTLINDPIEVLVHFHHGQLKPLRFLWRHHSYHINSITTQYHTRDGGLNYLHFAVVSIGNLYELVYNLNHHTWKLTQTSTLTG